MKKLVKTIELGGRSLTFEIGKIAQQANSAVLASYGETMVLSTVVSSLSREDLDFFPLSVEYIERLYAGGRIKGSRWVKREGRPSDEAILIARLIDRSIRPLFPKEYKNEVQVMVTVLSVDGQNDPAILSLLATSVALAISDIPWNGPIAASRVGWIAPKNAEEGHFIFNPLTSELDFSDLDLVIAGTTEKIVMLEGKARQVPEDIIVSSIDFVKDEFSKIINLINELVEEIGKKKQEYQKEQINSELLEILKKNFKKEIDETIMKKINKEEEGEELVVLSEKILEKYGDKFDKREIFSALNFLFKKFVRQEILTKETRPDGRKPDEIRKISCEVGVLPRTHGSALFTRGQTQVLNVTTLGVPSLEQLIEAPTGEETKRYIHHYSMPPYSVGEVGKLGWPTRREVGHGALAEKALEPVIPSEERFPYTIRLVSEVMSSNGSTSMASVCASTLSLMDAGVPISAPVAGVAIGLVSEKEKNILLTDILGIEDFCGDMDFKVAGTKEGITAIQLDIKIDGINTDILTNALQKARQGRLFILDKMLEVLPEPRREISQFAPKVEVLHVPKEKIGEVIGSGGKIIRQIITETNCAVEVEDDGTVTVSGATQEEVSRAINLITGLTKEIQVGEIYEGVVKRILPFGAFVEILPGKEGLVHISQMAMGFVKKPEDVVKLDQKVKVRVIKVDEQGRVDLSMLFGENKKRNSFSKGRFPRDHFGPRF